MGKYGNHKDNIHMRAIYTLSTNTAFPCWGHNIATLGENNPNKVGALKLDWAYE